MDYSIDVHSISARLVDDEGHGEEASFFVPGAAGDGFDAGSLLSRLNDPKTRFLPCRIVGHVELVQVDRIAYIEFRERLLDLSRLREVGAQKMPVTLRLADHESVSGHLIYEAPAIRSRVSDLLNRDEPRFLILSSPGIIRLIHRRAVLRVRV